MEDFGSAWEPQTATRSRFDEHLDELGRTLDAGTREAWGTSERARQGLRAAEELVTRGR